MNQHAGYKCTHGMPITDGHTSISHTTATQVSKPEQATEPWSNLRISQVKKCEPLDPQSWDQSHSCMDQYQQQHQPQHQVLKFKMYRSTVLGSKDYKGNILKIRVVYWELEFVYNGLQKLWENYSASSYFFHQPEVAPLPWIDVGTGSTPGSWRGLV